MSNDRLSAAFLSAAALLTSCAETNPTSDVELSWGPGNVGDSTADAGVPGDAAALVADTSGDASAPGDATAGGLDLGTWSQRCEPSQLFAEGIPFGRGTLHPERVNDCETVRFRV